MPGKRRRACRIGPQDRHGWRSRSWHRAGAADGPGSDAVGGRHLPGALVGVGEGLGELPARPSSSQRHLPGHSGAAPGGFDFSGQRGQRLDAGRIPAARPAMATVMLTRRSIGPAGGDFDPVLPGTPSVARCPRAVAARVRVVVRDSGQPRGQRFLRAAGWSARVVDAVGLGRDGLSQPSRVRVERQFPRTAILAAVTASAWPVITRATENRPVSRPISATLSPRRGRSAGRQGRRARSAPSGTGRRPPQRC